VVVDNVFWVLNVVIGIVVLALYFVVSNGWGVVVFTVGVVVDNVVWTLSFVVRNVVWFADDDAVRMVGVVVDNVFWTSGLLGVDFIWTVDVVAYGIVWKLDFKIEFSHKCTCSIGKFQQVDKTCNLERS
jgi:hypothetical protein